MVNSEAKAQTKQTVLNHQGQNEFKDLLRMRAPPLVICSIYNTYNTSIRASVPVKHYYYVQLEPSIQLAN